MRRVKNLYALIAAILVGCTSDYYRIPAVDEQEPVAIQFGAGSNRVHTRADLTGDAAANALGNAFHVYGTKDVNGITNIVYPNYVVEYNGAPLSTSSNSKGWEYVGLAAHPSQTLHYWDYSADSYTFQAWSGTTGGATVTIDSPSTLTIEAPTTDDLAQLYIADLVHVNKTDVGVLNTYGGIVTFNFRNMTTRVRLGIYETVPGYTVRDVVFRSTSNRFANSNTNALLDGSFNAADGTTGGIFHVTYNTTTSRAELTNNTAATVATYHDFGTFARGDIGTDNASPTWAGGSAAYHSVLPNEDNAGDMTLYIDFTMYPTDGSSEDILYVKGAHVTVPASYMVWHPNYAYTYLFKITKDVNGTTGEEGVDPVKLYPITFNAIVAEDTEGGTYEFEM